MSLKSLATMVVLLLFSLPLMADPSRDKVTVLTEVSTLSERLVRIAERQLTADGVGSGVSESVAKEVADALSTVDNPDVLSRVAIVAAGYMYPGSPEHVAVDQVFDVAWRMCVQRIEGVGGAEAVKALKDIKRRQLVDGGYSLLLNNALARLKNE